MSVEKEGGKKRKKRKKGRNPQENAKQLRGFAHARKIRLFPLETENGENNLCRLRIFLGSRRFSSSLSFSFPYRLWWRYEGSVIAIINRAGVQRCRSTSRAIPGTVVRSPPKTFDIYRIVARPTIPLPSYRPVLSAIFDVVR